MSKAIRFVGIAIVAALILMGAQSVREVLDVQVLNFPDPQTIKGTVTIDGPIRHAELVRIPDIIVPPVRPTDTTRLIQAGTIVTDGFTDVVLSLNGITKGDALKTGTVGVFLIPEEEIVLRTFVEAGQIQFPLEATVNVPPATPYFASIPEKRTVAFPRYRVLLYNTGDKSVTVNLFAYLMT